MLHHTSHWQKLPKLFSKHNKAHFPFLHRADKIAVQREKKQTEQANKFEIILNSNYTIRDFQSLHAIEQLQQRLISNNPKSLKQK